MFGCRVSARVVRVRVSARVDHPFPRSHPDSLGVGVQQTQMESVMNLLESRKMMGRGKRNRRPEQMHTMTRYRPNMVVGMDRFPTRGDFSFGPPPPAASALDPRHRH